MGETNGPPPGIKTFKDYQENDWQYIHKQYGLYDPASGQVFHCRSREDGLSIIEADPKKTLMSRHVSAWIKDE